MKRADDSAARSGAAAALIAALQSRGFETGDFQLEEAQSSEMSNLLDIGGGILRVHCWTTGEERLYSTGAGSGWLGAFLMDLGRGHFNRAARRLGPGVLPLSQPVSHLYA